MPLPALLLLLLLQGADPFEKDRFDRHIRVLAADDMKGRDNDTEEGRRAAQYVADRFKEFGLKPGAKEGYFQDFTARLGPASPKEYRGRNVVGLLEGEDPREVVVVAAHHDGLGVVEGRILNGADDNASGVALVLELARVFAGSKPRRSLLFVTFDCEEDGLLGSRHFVQSELYPAASIAALFVFDLVGGDLFEWDTRRLYALGSESSEALYERVGRAAKEASELDVARAGIYLIEPVPGLARSDYQAFRAREIPFVFLSSGTPWYYHTERDDPEVINLGKMVKAAGFVRRLIAETAADPKRPVFRRAAPQAEDVTLVRESLGRVLEAGRLAGASRERAVKLAEELASMKDPEPRKLQQGMMLLLAAARASQGGK